MLNMRYEPALRAAYNAVRAGAVGEVRVLHAQKSYRLGTRPDFFRHVLLPLLSPLSAALRRLEEILAEEDEAELAQSEVEWLERLHYAARDDATGRR